MSASFIMAKEVVTANISKETQPPACELTLSSPFILKVGTGAPNISNFFIVSSTLLPLVLCGIFTMYSSLDESSVDSQII